MKCVPKIGKLPWRDKRGVTGLETAIVLIAFVVVSAVFAFATLSTGLFSADKSKETIEAGLSEARGTLEVKGAVGVNATIATNTSFNVVGNDTGDLKTAFFPVVVGSDSFKKYRRPNDDDHRGQLHHQLRYRAHHPPWRFGDRPHRRLLLPGVHGRQRRVQPGQCRGRGGGGPNPRRNGYHLPGYRYPVNQHHQLWGDPAGLADRDNLVEAGETFQITVDTKTFGLTDEDTFTIQVKPAQGAVVLLERTIPTRIEAVMFLE